MHTHSERYDLFNSLSAAAAAATAPHTSTGRRGSVILQDAVAAAAAAAAAATAEPAGPPATATGRRGSMVAHDAAAAAAAAVAAATSGGAGAGPKGHNRGELWTQVNSIAPIHPSLFACLSPSQCRCSPCLAFSRTPARLFPSLLYFLSVHFKFKSVISFIQLCCLMPVTRAHSSYLILASHDLSVYMSCRVHDVSNSVLRGVVFGLSLRAWGRKQLP